MTDRLRSYWQQIIPSIFLLVQFEESPTPLSIRLASPTISQWPPTIINIEPRSRAAFPLSVGNVGC